ncbi:protein MLN51 homolog [Typha angustifolia]|uniref:protein MLN51 homolog n=1 Tax=Typha angustifolia TaxID=59011 RepID=UPI003C2F7B04
MAETREEVEYESDPEDSLLPAMRRREASDDEDGEGSDGGKAPVKDKRAGIGSDGDSDGQGGAEVYDDEEDYDEEDEDLEEELEEEDAKVEVGMQISARKVESTVKLGSDFVEEVPGGEAANGLEKDEVQEEEKKENEPYAVPTAGAFYMHDDRFQENGRGRHRRTFDQRKIWDPKDEQAWVHDRFEEMNLQDSHRDEERRRSRGRFRGRGGGRRRGTDRGYLRGSRSHTYHDDGNNQSLVPKSVRGRGPRRYEFAKKISEIPATPPKQSTTPQEHTSNASTGRQSSQTSNVQQEPVIPRKHVFASSLNSASPPFYPSGSSNQDLSVPQRRDLQNGSTYKNLSSSTQMDDSFLMAQPGPSLRGKANVDSIGHDNRYYSDAIQSAVKNVPNSALRPSGFTSNSRVQGRDLNFGVPPNSESPSSFRQGSRIPAQIQTPVVPQRPVQTNTQPALIIPSQQLSHQFASVNQTSSTPQPSSTSLAEDGETDPPLDSNKLKTPLAGKGKISNQGSGRGSFLSSGAPGAVGPAHGDQGFPGTPALLPVMQFGSQHHGVPAVGMALPGYVAQPQLGFGNSEMAWVPLLAGANGALGASYCPPYIALDNGYYARPAGQTSSPVSSRETSSAKAAVSFKALECPDIVHEEFRQRQNKPRRYSEMNFGQ